MGETADRLVADIAITRRAMDRDLHALETRLKREASLQTQVRKHPWFFAGLAASIVVVGILFCKSLRA